MRRNKQHEIDQWPQKKFQFTNYLALLFRRLREKSIYSICCCCGSSSSFSSFLNDASTFHRFICFNWWNRQQLFKITTIWNTYRHTCASAYYIWWYCSKKLSSSYSYDVTGLSAIEQIDNHLDQSKWIKWTIKIKNQTKPRKKKTMINIFCRCWWHVVCAFICSMAIRQSEYYIQIANFIELTCYHFQYACMKRQRPINMTFYSLSLPLSLHVCGNCLRFSFNSNTLGFYNIKCTHMIFTLLFI